MRWVESVKNGVYDVFFPPHCVACQAHGSWWCESCRSGIQFASTNVHLNIGVLDGLVATGWYHDQKLRSAITGLKYRGATCIEPLFKQYLMDWKESHLGPWPWAGEEQLLIQSIPGAPSHVRSRGFDQTEIIARCFQAAVLPWTAMGRCVQRADEDRLPQARLETGLLRKANVQELFYILPNAKVPEAVLLVDDVYTTGSTMQEVARVLKKVGTKRVYGAVLAVGK